MSVAADGRRLLRLEVRNSETPIEKKPAWIKTTARMGPEYQELQALVKREGLHTCARRPAARTSSSAGKTARQPSSSAATTAPAAATSARSTPAGPTLDYDEPRRVGESVQAMGLRYATVTGVARDDLDDEGAWLYAETVRAIHGLNPGTGVEILTPDFSGKRELLQLVFDATPEVFAHNVETVPRIFRRIRPAFSYDRSLEVLAMARAAAMVTKSNLILGLGETPAETSHALRDLRDVGCELVTITQYLRPSARHHPVDRWVKPEEFVALREEAEELGFAGVMSGPLVRSSYRPDGCTGRPWRHVARRSRPASRRTEGPQAAPYCHPGQAAETWLNPAARVETTASRIVDYESTSTVLVSAVGGSCRVQLGQIGVVAPADAPDR